MKRHLAAVALVLGCTFVVAGQAPSVDPKLLAQMKSLFPAATGFSAKEGDPRHIKAFTGGPGAGQQLAGFIFFTTEVEPLERAYDGPIKMLVGMDTQGVLTGVVVIEHHEPYGNISIERPEFPKMFKGKRIRDPFKVGMDVDAVSRATITMTSATRAIKNSSRRIARTYLSPEAVK